MNFKQRVVGGEEVQCPHQFPWLVTVNCANPGWLCTGSLIDPEWVLTAGEASQIANCCKWKIQLLHSAHTRQIQFLIQPLLAMITLVLHLNKVDKKFPMKLEVITIFNNSFYLHFCFLQGHCVVGCFSYDIYLGTANRNDLDEDSLVISVDGLDGNQFQHPNYTAFGSIESLNDIALIPLPEPAPLNGMLKINIVIFIKSTIWKLEFLVSTKNWNSFHCKIAVVYS